MSLAIVGGTIINPRGGGVPVPQLVTMHAEATFPANPLSAVEARRFAEKTLHEWGCGLLVDPTRLLVSELVVNAVVHAATPAALRLMLRDDSLRVEVRDGSTQAPQRRPYAPRAIDGRGLMIVEAIADSWGFVADQDGKTVWFELSRSR